MQSRKVVRQSLFGVVYSLLQAETNFLLQKLAPYYDQLLEGLSELCNLEARVTPYAPEDDGDYSGASLIVWK